MTLDDGGICAFDSALDAGERWMYVAASCSWRLEHDTTGDSNAPIANELRVKLEGASVDEFHLSIGQEDGKLVLWNQLGDPDLWQFVEYTRTD